MQTECQSEELEVSNTMHPQSFVMISKAYTDGVSLQKDGPQLTKEFNSVSTLVEERYYETAAHFVPKLVAKHFVTTLTVGDELTYYESIAFERKTVMQNFSETTNIFIPKDKINKYCSSLFFEPDTTTKLYTAGIELLPAKKYVVREETSNYKDESDATDCVEKGAINGDLNDSQQTINGEM